MIAVLLFLLLLLPSVSEAIDYQTLRMARPVASTSSGATGLHSSNRVYRAYTGIPYEIHADAVGGKWPYTYSLSGAPAGMTISAGPCTDIGPTGCTAGTITWPSPTTGTTGSITVTITDALGTQVTGTWSIVVNTTVSAGNFCFIDAVSGNDTTGSGTLAAPWQTLGKAWTSCGAGSFLYIRAGNYTTTGMNDTENTMVSSGYRKKVSINENTRPVIWMPYPGDAQPVIDFGATGSNQVQMFEATGNTQNAWIDGLKFTNVQCIGFKFSRAGSEPFGVLFRKNWFAALQDGYSEGNCSFVMLGAQYNSDTLHPSYYDTFQNNTFEDVHGDGGAADPEGTPPGGDVSALDQAVALKTYSTRYLLIENNAFLTSAVEGAMIETKTENGDMTVRANTFASDMQAGMGGNLHATVLSGASLACTVDPTTNTLTKTSHGFSNDQEVVFNFTTAPTGLSIETHYFVVNTAANTFQVAAIVGGAAIDFSTNGLDCWVFPSASIIRTGGDIYHNKFLGSYSTSNTGEITLGVARTWEIDPIRIYRNTFIGGQLNASLLKSQDGPFTFDANVIVNGQAAVGSCPQYITCYSVVDYSAIVINGGNLLGANDGSIANATTGVLVGASRTTYLGVAGFELASVAIGSGGAYLRGGVSTYGGVWLK